MTLQGGTSNANNGRTLDLNVSTAGLNNIVISFATIRTSTGFNSNQLQYSLDGVAFVDFGAPYTPPLTFGLVTFDLSSISGLNDNPDAAFRIVFNGATSATGNNRIDNLVVEGQNIATPNSRAGINRAAQSRANWRTGHKVQSVVAENRTQSALSPEGINSVAVGEPCPAQEGFEKQFLTGRVRVP